MIKIYSSIVDDLQFVLPPRETDEYVVLFIHDKPVEYVILCIPYRNVKIAIFRFMKPFSRQLTGKQTLVTQTPVHKHQYTNTSTQTPVHKYQYTNTNTQTPVHKH